ncbi:MAG: DUF4031 domain-containing protein [bacterium]|nr:DUF4031 domain-containing protein [bacterium]
MSNSRIYIDAPRTYGNNKTKWSHMISEDLEHLHLFAKFLTIPRSRFENKKGKGRPHYDIREDEYSTAVDNGAVQVSSRQIVKLLQQWNEQNT